MIALLCALSDLLLICAGIFGGSALLMQSPWLLALVTGRRGLSAMVWFWRSENGVEQQSGTGQRRSHEAGALENYRHHAGGHPGLTRMSISTLSSCWAARGQLAVEPKRWFALGTISASFLWFFGTALLAAWLAPRLRTARAQRLLMCWSAR